jgi:hypothetical protein
MSAPTPQFGAPSLGPADRNPRLITPPAESARTPAWDDPAPAAWRAFGEPANPKENTPMGDYMTSPMGGGYGVEKPCGQDKPIEPPPAPQPATEQPEQKPEAEK